jgi:hypothetical protein
VTIQPADALAHMPFISDSNLNKFAIDTSQYANTTRDLVGFIKGKRIVVTYYRLLNREGMNNRSNVSDLTNARNITETEYQKIIGLEITLPQGFDFQANNEQASVQITGKAMFYPNMNPNIGDIFLTGVGDGRIGMCRVTQVTPGNWRSDRIYIINFVVQEFLEHVVALPIDDSVTVVSYFSKENYLGGTAALLAEQTYLQLAKIRDQRSILSRQYHMAFFDPILNSYVRPDGLYDPWVVLYMCTKMRMSDVWQRPRNLLGQAKAEYNKTIWARLGDEYNNTLNLLNPCQQVRTPRQTLMGSFVTEIGNRPVLYTAPRSTASTDYIFSANFYDEVVTEMSAYEKLIYDAITKQTCGDLTSLIIDHLDPLFKQPLDVQFYKIPMCIHLIDLALLNQYREIDARSMNYAQSGDA